MVEAPLPRPYFNKCSPFIQEQSPFIIFKLGELQSIKRVQRAFWMKFFTKQPICVLYIQVFRRILEGFKIHASSRSQQVIGNKNVQSKWYSEEYPETHISHSVNVHLFRLLNHLANFTVTTKMEVLQASLNVTAARARKMAAVAKSREDLSTDQRGGHFEHLVRA